MAETTTQTEWSATEVADDREPAAVASATRPLRVTVVNDYELIVAGVAGLLEPYPDRVSVIELDVGTDPLRTVDIALFDTYGQPSLGLPRIRSLAESAQVGAVVVYTWALNEMGRAAALEAGARGFLAKTLPAPAVIEGLEAVAGGETVDSGRFRPPEPGSWPGVAWGLSARESETLALLTLGMANRAIAQALFVSENTVRTHLKSVFRKLGVTSRSQAVARALSDPSYGARRSSFLGMPNAPKAILLDPDIDPNVGSSSPPGA